MKTGYLRKKAILLTRLLGVVGVLAFSCPSFGKSQTQDTLEAFSREKIDQAIREVKSQLPADQIIVELTQVGDELSQANRWTVARLKQAGIHKVKVNFIGYEDLFGNNGLFDFEAPALSDSKALKKLHLQTQHLHGLDAGDYQTRLSPSRIKKALKRMDWKIFSLIDGIGFVRFWYKNFDPLRTKAQQKDNLIRAYSSRLEDYDGDEEAHQKSVAGNRYYRHTAASITLYTSLINLASITMLEGVLPTWNPIAFAAPLIVTALEAYLTTRYGREFSAFKAQGKSTIVENHKGRLSLKQPTNELTRFILSFKMSAARTYLFVIALYGPQGTLEISDFRSATVNSITSVFGKYIIEFFFEKWMRKAKKHSAKVQMYRRRLARTNKEVEPQHYQETLDKLAHSQAKYDLYEKRARKFQRRFQAVHNTLKTLDLFNKTVKNPAKSRLAFETIVHGIQDIFPWVDTEILLAFKAPSWLLSTPTAAYTALGVTGAMFITYKHLPQIKKKTIHLARRLGFLGGPKVEICETLLTFK